MKAWVPFLEFCLCGKRIFRFTPPLAESTKTTLVEHFCNTVCEELLIHTNCRPQITKDHPTLPQEDHLPCVHHFIEEFGLFVAARGHLKNTPKTRNFSSTAHFFLFLRGFQNVLPACPLKVCMKIVLQLRPVVRLVENPFSSNFGSIWTYVFDRLH